MFGAESDWMTYSAHLEVGLCFEVIALAFLDSVLAGLVTFLGRLAGLGLETLSHFILFI